MRRADRGFGRLVRSSAVAVGAITMVSWVPPTAAGSPPTTPRTAACDPLDPTACLLPFPNDFFTVADPSTGTGRRVHLALSAMPRNAAGIAIDPTEWNRNDGFSP